MRSILELRFVAFFLLGFLMTGLFTGDYLMHGKPTYWWWVIVANVVGWGLVAFGCCVLKKGRHLWGFTRRQWLASTTITWLIGFVLGMWILNLLHN